MTETLIALLKAAQDEGGVVVDAGFDPDEDPCEGCPLHNSFSIDALICCASCPKSQ